MNPINYQRIGEASQYYEKLGYNYVETSWFASEESSKVTIPLGKNPWYAVVKDNLNPCPLVGSAEQSLIDMVIKKTLFPGKYYAITPCWREEDTYDVMHQCYFMKLELMVIINAFDSPAEKTNVLKNMIKDAAQFFNKYAKVCEEKQEDGSIDLVCNGYELGSYGIREHRGNIWVYGTGLAEPRLSTVVRTLN